ncbi:MAG TPA: heme-copper oxidase subunit III [Terriglobales bacterium]|nr:heme-copper oxidase subunit III [Terriglobales bacterium]
MGLATLPPVAVEEPKLGGRGPTVGPPRDGDDHRGGGPQPDDFRDRVRRYRIGLFFGLASVVMLFVGFTSAYIVRQGVTSLDPSTGTEVSDWRPITLPPLLWANTAILLASSFTLHMARRRLARQVSRSRARTASPLVIDERGSVPWLAITVVLGVGFLAGQLLAWRQLVQQGILIGTNPSSSFFYVLTGTHGLHLLGGVVALIYAAATSLLHRPLTSRFVVVDGTSIYWHFMDFLWLYIFALLQFAR